MKKIYIMFFSFIFMLIGISSIYAYGLDFYADYNEEEDTYEVYTYVKSSEHSRNYYGNNSGFIRVDLSNYGTKSGSYDIMGMLIHGDKLSNYTETNLLPYTDEEIYKGSEVTYKTYTTEENYNVAYADYGRVTSTNQDEYMNNTGAKKIYKVTSSGNQDYIEYLVGTDEFKYPTYTLTSGDKIVKFKYSISADVLRNSKYLKYDEATGKYYVYISFTSKTASSQSTMKTASQFFDVIFGDSTKANKYGLWLRYSTTINNYNQILDCVDDSSKCKDGQTYEQGIQTTEMLKSIEAEKGRIEPIKENLENEYGFKEGYALTNDFAQYVKGLNDYFGYERGYSAINDFDNRLFFDIPSKEKSIYINYLEYNKDNKSLSVIRIPEDSEKEMVNTKNSHQIRLSITGNWLNLYDKYRKDEIYSNKSEDKKEYEKYVIPVENGTKGFNFRYMFAYKDDIDELNSKLNINDEDEKYRYLKKIRYITGNSNNEYDELRSIVLDSENSNVNEFDGKKKIQINQINDTNPILVSFVYYTPKLKSEVSVEVMHCEKDDTETNLNISKYQESNKIFPDITQKEESSNESNEDKKEESSEYVISRDNFYKCMTNSRGNMNSCSDEYKKFEEEAKKNSQSTNNESDSTSETSEDSKEAKLLLEYYLLQQQISEKENNIKSLEENIENIRKECVFYLRMGKRNSLIIDRMTGQLDDLEKNLKTEKNELETLKENLEEFEKENNIKEIIEKNEAKEEEKAAIETGEGFKLVTDATAKTTYKTEKANKISEAKVTNLKNKEVEAYGKKYNYINEYKILYYKDGSKEPDYESIENGDVAPFNPEKIYKEGYDKIVIIFYYQPEDSNKITEPESDIPDVCLTLKYISKKNISIDNDCNTSDGMIGHDFEEACYEITDDSETYNTDGISKTGTILVPTDTDVAALVKLPVALIDGDTKEKKGYGVYQKVTFFYDDADDIPEKNLKIPIEIAGMDMDANSKKSGKYTPGEYEGEGENKKCVEKQSTSYSYLLEDGYESYDLKLDLETLEITGKKESIKEWQTGYERAINELKKIVQNEDDVLDKIKVYEEAIEENRKIFGYPYVIKVEKREIVGDSVNTEAKNNDNGCGSSPGSSSYDKGKEYIEYKVLKVRVEIIGFRGFYLKDLKVLNNDNAKFYKDSDVKENEKNATVTDNEINFQIDDYKQRIYSELKRYFEYAGLVAGLVKENGNYKINYYNESCGNGGNCTRHDDACDDVVQLGINNPYEDDRCKTSGFFKHLWDNNR